MCSADISHDSVSYSEPFITAHKIRSGVVRREVSLLDSHRMDGGNIAYAEWLDSSHCPNGTIKHTDRRCRH